MNFTKRIIGAMLAAIAIAFVSASLLGWWGLLIWGPASIMLGYWAANTTNAFHQGR
jgi:thiol:disulfide interchange protein